MRMEWRQTVPVLCLALVLARDAAASEGAGGASFEPSVILAEARAASAAMAYVPATPALVYIANSKKDDCFTKIRYAPGAAVWPVYICVDKNNTALGVSLKSLETNHVWGWLGREVLLAQGWILTPGGLVEDGARSPQIKRFGDDTNYAYFELTYIYLSLEARKAREKLKQ